MKKTTTTHFAVDFLNKKIIGTKASFDKASKGIGSVYEELTNLIVRHPAFELEVKEQKKRITRSKRTYDGLNFEFIEKYISIQERSEVRMSEYRNVRKFAEDNNISVYPFVKKWFLGEFDPNNEGFDMAKAKQEINEHYMKIAVLNSAAPTEQSEENVTELPAVANM